MAIGSIDRRRGAVCERPTGSVEKGDILAWLARADKRGPWPGHKPD
jgi:hypothetical protein